MITFGARAAALLCIALLSATAAAAQKLVTQGGPFANLSAPDFASSFASVSLPFGIWYNSAPAVASARCAHLLICADACIA